MVLDLWLKITQEIGRLVIMIRQVLREQMRDHGTSHILGIGPGVVCLSLIRLTLLHRLEDRTTLRLTTIPLPHHISSYRLLHHLPADMNLTHPHPGHLTLTHITHSAT